MIRPLLLVIAVLQSAVSIGQVVYGNEWVDHDRQYWRFPVYSTGLHRLDSASLAASGFPIASVDPADLLLFGREKQVPLYIEGGEDGVLNSGDFIEFIARKNDGWIDTRMYGNAQQHANPYYSQFNDTIRYFLTWNPDPLVKKERVVPYANTDFVNYAPRPWVWGNAIRPSIDFYWAGAIDVATRAASGLHVPGEGWGGAGLFVNGATGNATVVTPTPQAYTGLDAPPARIIATSSSFNSAGNLLFDDHHLQVYAGSSQTLVKDTIFRGSVVMRSVFDLPVAQLTDNFSIRFSVPHDLPLIDPAYLDFQAPAAITVSYPRTPQFLGLGAFDFWIPNQVGEDIARVDLAGFTGTPILYAAGDTMRRILPTLAGAVWQALVPAHADSSTTRNFLHAASGIRNVAALTPVNGTGYFVNYGDMDPDSAFLMVAHHSLWNGASAYAAYRSGGGPRPRPTVLADVDELYDQFGGGVPKSSVAIRMWCKYILDTWSTKPEGLFLVGKSVVTSSVLNSQAVRPGSPGAYERCLVPTYGHPASDQCFTIGLNFDQRKVEIPVGRLSAINDQDVFNYLGKVQAFEGQPVAAWMKNVVHLSGGFTIAEQNGLAENLRGLEPGLDETSSFGAVFTRFRKNSSETFSSAAADSVRYLIENGVTLMNFFAHAYSENFDITIDDPANYDWNGRYPMVIGNSCYIGNIHLNLDHYSTSEDWVMRDASGPIAFMASTDLGFQFYLATYSQGFYRSMGGVNYGRSIGEHMRSATFDLLNGGADLLRTYSAHTITLQGDPSLVLNSPDQPDFEIRSEDIVFDPATVNADVDTFSVKAMVRNIGRILPDTVRLELERTNDGLSAPQIFSTSLSNITYEDTAIFRVPTMAFAGGQGVNQFNVRVDLNPDLIDEIEDAVNNTASTTVFITSGDLVPTYPYDFAVVPEPMPMLKASTGDPLAPLRTYVFQIDTTDLFNSPVFESSTFTSPGGVVAWQPSAVYAINSTQDSTVFFWRCSIDSTGNGGYQWYERSFQYIQGRHGWGQAHFFQFKNDKFNSVVYDRPERDFDFSTAPHEISAWSPGNDYFGDIGWRLDLVNQDYNGCAAEASWHVAVVDPYTFESWGTRFLDTSQEPPVWLNPDHNFGNQNDGGVSNCGLNRVKKYFAFRQNIPAQMAGMNDMLNNAVPDGFHLIFYTWLYMDQDGMGPQLINTLESSDFGAPISSLPDSVPYIFYVRKGFPETFRDTVGLDINSDIRLTCFIESSGDVGFITALEAGPAAAWGSLHWNEVPVSLTDSTVIQVKGVTTSGEVVDLVEFDSAVDDVLNLSDYVDAAAYPKVRLHGKFHDLDAPVPVPAQLQRWQLLYEPAPECAINPQLGYFQGLDGWFQGQDASVAVAVQNISEFDMDSLLMAAWVVDRNNTKRLVHYIRRAPLPAGAWQLDTIRFSTLGFGGPNTLIVEANPVDTLTGQYDQLEQYHFNNIAQWRFDVAVDRENPLLDVTFDGIHILDGDIVSARPEIEVLLNDENTALIMDSPADTALFTVLLTRPGTPIERIYFRDGMGNENLQFIPADGPENEARIFYRPDLPTDGKYILTVRAKDLSNNASGDKDYSIAFEVINRPTITEVLNYPNPFTTNTRFVFTLTGTEIPTYMKIQIMTITGKVVREVKMHELGPLRVGRNMTDFAWDGTDEFGDRLARGVYLYRVIAQMNGADIEYRQTGAAGYFTKGFGKMYLLR